MKDLGILIAAIMLLGVVFLYPEPLMAQEKNKSTKFVDRDGDGIHDGMEHRFRRGKKRKSKRHGNRRNTERHRHQNGNPQNQSPKGP